MPPSGRHGPRRTAYALRELARRQLGCVDLLDEEQLGVDHRLQVDAQALGPVEQEAELLVEHEHRRALAPIHGALHLEVSTRSDLPAPAGPRIRMLEPAVRCRRRGAR